MKKGKLYREIDDYQIFSVNGGQIVVRHHDPRRLLKPEEWGVALRILGDYTHGYVFERRVKGGHKLCQIIHPETWSKLEIEDPRFRRWAS